MPEVPDGAILATDPAKPYGNSLAWPRLESRRLARVAGAGAVLHDRSRLHSFADPSLEVAQALHSQAQRVRGM